MAVSLTQLATISTSTSNVTSYAGTAGTPSGGDDCIIVMVLASDTVITTPTMTGTWTWTLFHQVIWNTVDSLYLFWAKPTAATLTTPTFDCTGDAATGCLIYGLRIVGSDKTGAPYLRQLKSVTGTGANPSITLDQAPLSTSGMLGIACNIINSATQFSGPAAWTERTEGTFNTPPHAMQVAVRAGETSATLTWTNAQTAAWMLCVLEIPIASGGGMQGFKRFGQQVPVPNLYGPTGLRIA